MASRSFKSFVEQKLGRFAHFLIYAILEWVIIILLFIDGFLGFFVNEFAKFFELRIPCLFCTRIDHVLVRRNPDFYYNDSICETHKKDISSLAYCHVHRKLSNIKTICEGCLLSFATEKESGCDTYKSLVGILHKDIDCFVEDDRQSCLKSSGKKDDTLKVEMNSGPKCSCCGEPLKIRASTKSYTRTSSSKNYARSLSRSGSMSQAPAPSPRAPTLTWRNEESRSLELPHIRYTELKFMSDNESDLPEDEDGPRGNILKGKEDNKVATMPLLPDFGDLSEDACKTPSFTKGNRFFGIPLTDSSAQASPRWSNRLAGKLLFEKTDLVLDSNDSNATNEADGDFILHHLKKQVRLDRRSLIALYMELDEERSFSAIAANNAMAMITRLQAEKAAVQMEALQYQRMMEEQAEYDQEALQDMKDLLVKKEEENKILEVELEAYREKNGEIMKVGSEDCEADEDKQELKYQSFSSFSEKSDGGSLSEVDHNGENEHNSERLGENGGCSLEESSLDFQGEQCYLLDLFKNLEKKINSSSDEGTRSSESISDMIKHENENTGHANNAILTRLPNI